VEELTDGVTGACRQFRIEILAAPATAAAAPTTASSPAASAAPNAAAAAVAARTLMIFDGCPRPLGCTVLLRGGSAAELTKVKRVVKHAVLAAYHAMLEGAFVAEELALAEVALAPAGSTLDDLALAVRSAVERSTVGSGTDPPRSMALSMSPHTVLWEEVGDEERYYCSDSEDKEECAAAVGGSAAEQRAGSSGADAPDSSVTDAAAAGAAAAAAAGAAAAVAGLSIEAASSEFTDPLRRVTPIKEPPARRSVDLRSPANGGGAVAAAVAAGGAGGARSAWVGGLRLYDRQRVFLSMACRNPRKQLLCEPPSIKRIDFYCQR